MNLLRLILCIDIFLSVGCTIFRKTNVSFLVEQCEDAFNYTCILEGSLTQSAVTWLTPLQSFDVNKPSVYLPVSKIYENYEDNVDSNWMANGWLVSSAFDFPFKPVTDWRWESFPIYTSSNSKFTHLSSFWKTTFTVSLSIRSQHPTAIYLCNAENPGISNKGCFLIRINGTKISVRFGNNQSSRKSMISNELKVNEWFHLAITYSIESGSHETKLRLLINNETLTCAIDGYDLQKKHLLVTSSELSLWKIHKYRFMSTISIVHLQQLGPAFRGGSNMNCISLQVALCSACGLNVITEYITGIQRYRKTNLVKTDPYFWKEVKIVHEITNTTEIHIYLEPYFTNISNSGFWAVDDIRECHINEIRVANVNIQKNLVIEKSTTDVYTNEIDNIKCHPLHHNPVSVSKTKSTTLNCEDQDKLGFSCNITCKSIFGERNCEKKLICMGENGEGSSNCHCSDGYQGAFCERECLRGTWGFACREKCETCKNSACNPRNGICQQNCVEGFIGEHCKKPATVKNLSIISTTMNEISIGWNSPFSLTSIEPSYVVKHKHKKYKGCKLDVQNTSQFTEITSSLYLSTENLLPYSEYVFEVAATISGVRGESTKILVTTSALDLFQPDEHIFDLTTVYSKQDNHPLLTWKEPSCSKMKGASKLHVLLTCLDEWCNENKSLIIPYVNNIDEEQRYVQSVPDLIPYTNYLVTMMPRRVNGSTQKAHSQIYLKTGEQAPPKVTDLTAYSRDESTISLRWKPPYPPHGKLVSYVFTCTGTTKCDSLRVSWSNCSLWKHLHCADIKNLQKNKEYTIKVEAVNMGIEKRGEAEYVSNIYTQQSQSDPPTNIGLTWNNDIPTLHWQHPDITNGPIVKFTIQIIIKESEHLNVSSFNENVTIERPISNYLYEMASLEYSTVYEITVYAINRFRGNPSDSRNITMPPLVPSFVILPRLDCTSDSKCELQIQKPVNTSLLSYLYVIIDNNPPTAFEDDKINKTQLLFDSANNAINNKTGWLAVAMSLSNNRENIFVLLGDDTTTTSKYGSAINKVMNKDTHYIYVILENCYLNKNIFSHRYLIHSTTNERIRNIFTGKSTEKTNTFYGLFSLLLIPIIIIGGWIMYRKCIARRSDGSEHGPEGLPLKESAGTHPEKISSEVMNNNCRQSASYTSIARYTCSTKLEKLESYVQNALWKSNGVELQTQFNLFPKGQTSPVEYAITVENMSKNRNNRAVPYDYNRVILEKLPDDEFSDYVNASYIKGNENKNAYIATQRPLPNTINDFWRMVWQENVNSIILIDNSASRKQEFFQYWPNVSQTSKYGPLSVYQKEDKYVDSCTRRIFHISATSEKRTVVQFHFTSWPEDQLPFHPQKLVPFLKCISVETGGSAPVIVHGDFGVGRTGTVILCDIILKMAKHKSEVDFLETLQALREQRPNLVSDNAQYKLAHLLVYEILFGRDTTVSYNESLDVFKKLLNSEKHLKEELAYLKNIYWVDQVLHWMNSNELMSSSNGSPFSIISHTIVDGFNFPEKYTVIQQPLPELRFDFWKLIADRSIETVVFLNDISSDIQSMIWPTEPNTEINFDDTIALKCLSRDQYINRDVTKVILQHVENNKHSECQRIVNIINMKGWESNEISADICKIVVAACEEMNKLSDAHDHVLIACRDGVAASGVFVTFSFLVDTMTPDKQVDICFAARKVRCCSQKLLNSEKQLRLLYQSILRYVEDFVGYVEIEM